MRFSRKHKFILISNWKCGCSTMANLFAPYSDFDYYNSKKCLKILGVEYHKMVHWPAYKIKTRFEKSGLKWSSYIKITTVRNPWARIVSLFFYKYKNAKQRPLEKIKKQFNEFVMTELPRWQKGIRNRWVTDEMIHHPKSGKKLVNYVIRIEHLQEELEPIIKKHFPKFKPFDYQTKRNTTNHDHYSLYYTRETRQAVARLFRFDIRVLEHERRRYH